MGIFFGRRNVSSVRNHIFRGCLYRRYLAPVKIWLRSELLLRSYGVRKKCPWTVLTRLMGTTLLIYLIFPRQIKNCQGPHFPELNYNQRYRKSILLMAGYFPGTANSNSGANSNQSLANSHMDYSYKCWCNQGLSHITNGPVKPHSCWPLYYTSDHCPAESPRVCFQSAKPLS